MIRFLMLIRAGRKVRWVDALLEPSFAVFAGMCMWAIGEVSHAPDVIQAVMTSIGAWGGPRTLARLENKYLGDLPKDEYQPPKDDYEAEPPK